MFRTYDHLMLPPPDPNSKSIAQFLYFWITPCQACHLFPSIPSSLSIPILSSSLYSSSLPHSTHPAIRNPNPFNLEAGRG